MNQIFGFMEFLKPLILDGTKVYTTRIEKPFRLKCDKNDIMHQFTGLRTKRSFKFADAKVLGRTLWNQLDIELRWPSTPFEESLCPVNGQVTWLEFAKREGFSSLEECYKWFTQPQYKNKNLITYEFRVIEVF